MWHISIGTRGLAMFKKLIGIITALMILLTCGIQAYAAGDDSSAIEEYNSKQINSVIRDADTKDNNNGIIEIKKPDDSITTTFKESFTISGETSKKNVKVYLAKYDADKDTYMLFENNDEESSWNIGSYGKFAKGIQLSKGTNKFKIVAVVVSDSERLSKDDIQVFKFTITYFEKSLADRLLKGIQDGITDFAKALNL